MMVKFKEHFRSLIKNRYLPRWVVLAGDTFIVIASFLLAYLLRFNFTTVDIDPPTQSLQLLFVTVAYLTGFILVKPFAGVIRHTTSHDLARIAGALMVGAVILLGYSIVVRGIAAPKIFIIPFSVLLIHLGVTGSLMGFSRLAIKYVYEVLQRAGGASIPVMIYGAGELGQATLLAIERTRKPDYELVGFIDTNRSLQGKSKSGVHIFSPQRALRRVIPQKRVQEIIMAISPERVLRKETEHLIESCVKLGLRVRKVPPVDEWINGNFSIRQARGIEITDLLGRQEIVLDTERIQAGLEGKRILVTGAAGSIGSELVRQLMAFRTGRLILLDQAESALYDLQMELLRKYNGSRGFSVVLADVTNRESLEALFIRERPEIVFNAAAYKHVPMLEEHVAEAVKVNIGGTRNLADLAVEYGCERFVMISTDKAVNPTSVMGATKRISEIYIQKLAANSGGGTSFVTTRFGNVLGSNGSVVPLFRKQIESGGPVTITHREVTRYFMTIAEACQLVLEAGFMGRGGEIFLFDMGSPVKIYNLAHKMITLAGFVPGREIEIIETGLRPGEKLYEEVLGLGESCQKTHNPKLLIASHVEVDGEEAGRGVEELLGAAGRESAEELVARMCAMVREFEPANEKYCELRSQFRV